MLGPSLVITLPGVKRAPENLPGQVSMKKGRNRLLFQPGEADVPSQGHLQVGDREGCDFLGIKGVQPIRLRRSLFSLLTIQGVKAQT